MQKRGVLVEIPILELRIIPHISECLHFFPKFKGTWKSSDLLLTISIAMEGHVWEEVSAPAGHKGPGFYDDLWGQKPFPAIKCKLWEERDDGLSRQGEARLRAKEGSISPKYCCAQCVSVPKMTVRA